MLQKGVNYGTPSGTRTRDPLIKSQVLLANWAKGVCLVLAQGLEPWTHRLKAYYSTNWVKPVLVVGVAFESTSMVFQTITLPYKLPNHIWPQGTESNRRHHALQAHALRNWATLGFTKKELAYVVLVRRANVILEIKMLGDLTT